MIKAIIAAGIGFNSGIKFIPTRGLASAAIEWGVTNRNTITGVTDCNTFSGVTSRNAFTGAIHETPTGYH